MSLLVLAMSVSNAHAVESSRADIEKMAEKIIRKQLERDNPESSPTQIDKMLQDHMKERKDRQQKDATAAEQVNKQIKETGIDPTATISTQTKMPGKMSTSDAASEIAALKQENAQLKLKISDLEKTIKDILSRLLKAKI
jgi:hypothetical protein